MREETSTSARLRALNNVDFAGLYIDQRDSAERNGVARLAAQRALLRTSFDAGLNFADPIADAAASVSSFFFAWPRTPIRPAPPPAHLHRHAAFAARRDIDVPPSVSEQKIFN